MDEGIKLVCHIHLHDNVNQFLAISQIDLLRIFHSVSFEENGANNHGCFRFLEIESIELFEDESGCSRDLVYKVG
jgi:hypothetical protein